MAKKAAGGGAKRKSIKFEVNADIDQTRFLKVYDIQCNIDKSSPCSWLVRAMKKGIEDRRYTREFIIETQDNPPVRLDPILNSIRKSHYLYMSELRVWDLTLPHSTVANIALLIEKGIYPVIKLELMDCDILWYSVERLVRSFRVGNLVDVNLDYNEFGDEGCEVLCNGCMHNKTILSLSLCYCKLTSKSGPPLGTVAFHSTIREFYLDGNRLEALGVEEMLRAAAVAAEDDHMKRIEEEKMKAVLAAQGGLGGLDANLTTQMGDVAGGSGAENTAPTGEKKKKKKKKGKKKKEEALPPVAGPQVCKIHFVDNGVDVYGEGRRDQLLSCIGVICRLLVYSHWLVEIDLDDNSISDLAAREVLEALKRRQLGDLPNVKVRLGCGIQEDTFKELNKLASGLAKKKKKGKKKKKK